MDEYIKRDDAIKALCAGCNDRFSDEPCEPSDCEMRNAINSIRTADVAPRAEVAREIFEEIENSDSLIIAGLKHYIICERELAELKKKYTEGK